MTGLPVIERDETEFAGDSRPAQGIVGTSEISPEGSERSYINYGDRPNTSPYETKSGHTPSTYSYRFCNHSKYVPNEAPPHASHHHVLPPPPPTAVAAFRSLLERGWWRNRYLCPSLAISSDTVEYDPHKVVCTVVSGKSWHPPKYQSQLIISQPH